ncbi:large ribosomal subunit protein mL62 [Austrofundulus limnaeus]|uniref:Large ribosomal subunit protein mL62 n=1 Tax=Austrofundulus limnaeus TaxID=52670 RepID=A0A2I4CMY5_AUSLI|nr:PREDICTED: peptidyl-tRNA hydrolase ICT1, mitochondrial [Austrofundulus limnaeus]
MASRIARCSFLLLSCAEKNIVSLHRSVVRRLSDSTSSSKPCCGTPGADDAEDTPVHIPLDRLTVSYSRSSGPGGQHVNKTNTKAEVRFHLHTADWIPEDVRQKVLEKNKNRITKAGELLVTSEVSRSQQRNLSDCIQKISAMIAEASEKPRQASAEDIALRAARLEKRNKERLRQKKIHSAIKHSRRVDFD